MANETTTTTWSAAKGLQLTAVLGTQPFPPNMPRPVMLALINQDSIPENQPSLVKRYSKVTDPGVASGATEGTALSTNKELTADTAVDITLAENAAVMSEITDLALAKKFPGMSAADLIQRANPAEVMAALGPFGLAHTASLWEKVEADIAGDISGLSTSAGTSGAEMSLAALVSAQYKLAITEPQANEVVYVATARQIRELTLEIGVTNGGFGGGVWAGAAQSSAATEYTAMAGFAGNLLGVPVFQISESVKDTAGSDEYGVLMIRGRGAPDEPGAQISPFVYVEGRPMIQHYAELDAAGRAVRLVSTHLYGKGEIKDSAGVAIISSNA